MPLSFGASTFSYMRREPALASVRRLRQLGYRIMDILAVPGHLWPNELSAAERMEWRRAAERDDIIIDSLNPQPIDLNIGSCNDEVRAFSVATYADMIRLAKDIGARTVVVVPGRVPMFVPPNANDTLEWAAESVATLSDVARTEGMEMLLLENHPMTAFPMTGSLNALCERVGQDNIRIAYDVANAEFVGEDQLEAIATLGDRIGQIHLSDARPGLLRHDPPGTGTVRFEAILTALEARGFPGVNILELISDQPEEDFCRAAETLAIPRDLPGELQGVPA